MSLSSPQDGLLLRDIILPIAEVTERNDEVHLTRFRGTGFLVGDSGLALTAAHVVAQPAETLVALVLNPDLSWSSRALEQVHIHQREDAACAKVSGDLPASPIRVSGDHVHASLSWIAWGYPDEVQFEVITAGQTQRRPDLVCAKGYVRRRLSDLALPGISGRSFLELSEAGGSGFSGAPILAESASAEGWDLYGIYVGEKTSEQSNRTIGFATPASDLKRWADQFG